MPPEKRRSSRAAMKQTPYRRIHPCVAVASFAIRSPIMRGYIRAQETKISDSIKHVKVRRPRRFRTFVVQTFSYYYSNRREPYRRSSQSKMPPTLTDHQAAGDSSPPRASHYPQPPTDADTKARLDDDTVRIETNSEARGSCPVAKSRCAKRTPTIRRNKRTVATNQPFQQAKIEPKPSQNDSKRMEKRTKTSTTSM